MNKQEFVDDELGLEELDAVSGGACDGQDIIDALGGNPLIKAWVGMGCPVPKSK